MRGFLAFLFIALVGLGAGALGYQAGAASAVTTAAAGAGTVVYAGGWHLGWLLLPFGLFLFPLFLFTFFGFLAFVFGGHRRRWADHGPMGMHGDPGGFGPRGFGPMGGHGPFGRDRHDARREWVAEAHRHLHEEEAARAAGSSTASTSTPPSAPSAGPVDAEPR